MAISKAEFQAAAVARILDYPSLATLFRAQDPRVIANLDAMAAMLALISEQLDVAEFEPFLKSRDGTVLADATLKGVLPLARPAVMQLSAVNLEATPFTIATGRRLVDGRGRVYTVDAAVVVPPGNVSPIALTAIQRTVRTVTATVAPGGPYYRLPVPASAEPVFLSELTVTGPGGLFEYRPDYFNVAAGERVYQVETDENRTLSVVFGQSGVVGYEVTTGDVFTLAIEECEGAVTDLAIGSTFTFEYADTAAEGAITIKLDRVLDQGQAPLSLETLRQIARYPALYDHNAVYLGNFDFLLRRYLTPIEFLNVWNEQIEEKARGPSVENINTLFVAGRVTGMVDAVFQQRVTDLIRRADNSYRIRFVPLREFPVPVTIIVRVAVIHDPAEVTAQIRALVLSRYGIGAQATSVGGANPVNQKELSIALSQEIPALRDRISDVALSVDAPSNQLPEDFLFVSDDSLFVQVTQAPYNTGLWNY